MCGHREKRRKAPLCQNGPAKGDRNHYKRSTAMPQSGVPAASSDLKFWTSSIFISDLLYRHFFFPMYFESIAYCPFQSPHKNEKIKLIQMKFP